MPFIKLTYNITSDKFKVESDFKPEKIPEVLQEFIRGQMGLGKDTRKANKIECYKINLDLDLTEDKFTVSSNTGNDSLRDGIIAYYLSEHCKNKEA
jgi:hypothetical protein